MLKITEKREADKLNVALEGRLDTVTAPDLEKELKETLPGVRDLTLDFEKLNYISSAGLRVLLLTWKTMNTPGRMKILRANEMIREIFDTTGLSTIITIE